MKKIAQIMVVSLIAVLFLRHSESSAQGCCSSGAPLLGSMELGAAKAGLWQLALSYRINNRLNISNQLRYRHTTPDKFQKLDIPNTGGKWFYVVPGINVPLGNEITLRSSVEIPVYRNLSGIQLTTTYAFSFSAFYAFDLKLF